MRRTLPLHEALYVFSEGARVLLVDCLMGFLARRAAKTYTYTSSTRTPSTRIVRLRYDASCTEELSSLRIDALGTGKPAYPLASAPLTYAL